MTWPGNLHSNQTIRGDGKSFKTAVRLDNESYLFLPSIFNTFKSLESLTPSIKVLFLPTGARHINPKEKQRNN